MNREEMLEYMPHRGMNVLIDGYEDTGPTSGRGSLTIAEGDPHGRDLFLVRSPGGLRCSEFFLVEHVALTSILILRSEMGGGRLAYFSAISKFAAAGPAPAGARLVSDVRRGRDRAEFRSFEAEVRTAEGSPVLAVSFMAYLAPRGVRPEPRPPGSPPGAYPPATADRFPCLPPALVFPGGVYPAAHPFCAGHFPGAPVMMGMTQWLAVAERAAELAPAGATTEVAGSGGLTTEDGRPVAEVTGMRILVTKDDAGRAVDLALLETRRVAFRDRILPGDAYLAAFVAE